MRLLLDLSGGEPPSACRDAYPTSEVSDEVSRLLRHLRTLSSDELRTVLVQLQWDSPLTMAALFFAIADESHPTLAVWASRNRRKLGRLAVAALAPLDRLPLIWAVLGQIAPSPSASDASGSATAVRAPANPVLSNDL